MNEINTLFFELIQVALGVRVCLSHSPTAEEWKMLYDAAKKQSLVGVCFAGVQRLQTQRQEPPEMLYLTWMGMATKIQQRNEVVNRQCAELQAKLADDGIRSSILKGQGVGALYYVNPNANANLAMLRQSGDIDVFVAGGMEKVLRYCTEKFGKVEWDYINAHTPFYQDTEVEMHWRAQAMTNLRSNRKLQEWFKSSKVQGSIFGGSAKLADGSRLVVPTVEFNAFYILLHCYHHMFESGLGLRQLMDFYFVLRTSYENENIVELYEQFGMKRFASAVMWIMQQVFGMEYKYLLCEPNEEEGRFILNEVMQNGNFGHHDERVKKVGSGKMSELWRNVQHNWHLASHYQSEFFWQPVWLVYHFFWKRMIKNKI